MHHCSPTSSRSPRGGYTLVEIIVAVTVFSLLSVGVFAFFANSQKTMFKTTMKLMTAGEIRNLTAQLDNDGRNADAVILHDGFSGAFRSAADDDAIIDLRLTRGSSGEMIILLYYKEDPTPADTNLPPVDYIVCYTLGAAVTGADEYAPVYRIRVDSTNATEGFIPERLLPDSIAAAGDAAELARGFVGSNLFYKYGTNSVVFNLAIKNGNLYDTVNNIHNFTITCR